MKNYIKKMINRHAFSATIVVIFYFYITNKFDIPGHNVFFLLFLLVYFSERAYQEYMENKQK